MKVSLIVAMAENNVIGRNNMLPWHLPQDLKYFKSVTMGKPIIMGRKTFESIGRPLPGRANIVISRNADFKAEGVTVVASVEEALAHAESVTLIDGVDEAMVIGGAEIYRLAYPKADRFYLTQVHDEVPGDAYFQEVDFSEWQEIGRENYSADESNPFDYSFIVYDRAA